MVYENYSKFITASDTLSGIKDQMGDLDSDLDDLKKSIGKVNDSYHGVEASLSLKWREIRKLDTMEKDLNKLKYLSELPNMFKKALTSFQNDNSDSLEALSLFKEPVQYYSDYSDILADYKQTKFMISLYGEIKSYVARIRQILGKQLDQIASTTTTVNSATSEQTLKENLAETTEKSN